MHVGLAGDPKLPPVGLEVKWRCEGIWLQGTPPPQDGAAPFLEPTEPVKTQITWFDQDYLTTSLSVDEVTLNVHGGGQQ